MKKYTDGLYAFGLAFMKAAGALLLLLLFVSGFLYTCYADDMTTQLVLKKMDNPLRNLAGLAILLGAAVLICRWAAGDFRRRKRLLLLMVLGWCALLGLLLVVFGKTVPAADAMSVYSIAESLAGGNTGVIHPTESYLSYYPQQVGLVAFYEGIIRLWKLLPVQLPAYHIIKCINVGLACAMVWFLYRCVQLLFSDDRADVFFLLLAGGNLPLIMYTSFVYGEIPSFTAFCAGLYFLLRFLGGTVRSHKAQNAYSDLAAMRSDSGIPTPDAPHASPNQPDSIRRTALAAGAVLCLTFSVMLRKNALILIIAVLIVLFLEWLKTGRHSLLILAAACALCAFSILPLVQKGYELRAGSNLSRGVPAVSYLAMGMQESSRGNGWYNGFNFNTYQASGMDDAQTAALSRAAISERLAYFKDHPGYAAAFYRDKFLSQWADGSYACRQATLATFGGRREPLQQLYEGRYSGGLIAYCNAYQNLLYLGAALFALSALKKRPGKHVPGLPVYLCLIGVLGGLLFHMLWEANARYIFTYGLLLLPYAAAGIAAAFGRAAASSKPSRTSRQTEEN